MLKSYFIIATRILLRHKVYVLLNITGLGFAMACCMLAYLNYDYRAGFDSNFSNTSAIYRINSKREMSGSVQQWGLAPLALVESLVKDNSGIKQFARLFSTSGVVKNNEQAFTERVFYADPAFFDFFNFKVLTGNISQLHDRNKVIISESFASKMFNHQSAMNRKITLTGRNGIEQVFTVAAVLEKPPGNSSFQFDIITAFDNYFNRSEQINWRNDAQVSVFVEISDKKLLPDLERSTATYAGIYNSSRHDSDLKGFVFQPFRDIAFSSDRDMEGYVYGSALEANPRGVIVFGPAIMSMLILLIACFNFTNISISFAGKRLKEIGLRKVLGGRRLQVIKQFLAENLLLCGIASLLAVVFTWLLLPSFNSVSSLGLTFNFKDISLYLFLVLLPFFTAIISGLYPAMYISSFRPISILKGHTTFGSSSRFTRFLMISQFSLSCLALLIGIALSKNASYQEKVDYGYAINELAVLQLDSTSDYTILSNALKTDSRIKSVAGTMHQAGEGAPLRKVSVGINEIKANVAGIGGEEYLATAGIKLKEGRHFYTGKGPDRESSVLVNQTLLAALNLKSAIGQKIQVDSAAYTIIGVVEDYKELGLHGKVPPIVLKMAAPEEYKYLVARIEEANLTGVFKSMQDTWHRTLPSRPFRGFLQKELIEKEIYLNAGFKSIAFFLALSTIVLSASGIFALVSLNIIRRKKEIGIRKVMGASITSIITLINKDYIRIILLSFIIGSALGFLLIDKLLFKFVYVYHAEIGVWPFILTLFVILFSSAITIGTKVYGAATANPVKSLRTE